MSNKPTNIILIGMPGAGKTTIGKMLAKKMSRGFVDTDQLIESSQGCKLQDIVDKRGNIALRKIEEEVMLSLSISDHVIATGGSAVYSHSGMNHLRTSGAVIFLDTDKPTIEKRIQNFEKRGLAKKSNQTLSDLFHERYALYSKFADLIINCNGLTKAEICKAITREIKEVML